VQLAWRGLRSLVLPEDGDLALAAVLRAACSARWCLALSKLFSQLCTTSHPSEPVEGAYRLGEDSSLTSVGLP